MHLLGHSFGALCCLEAALRTQNLAKLVLYEPVIAVEGYILPTEVVGPSWQARLAAAHTVPRELADMEYALDAARFQEMRAPTVLLSGSESPPFLKTATKIVETALPVSQIVVRRSPPRRPFSRRRCCASC